jgi:hypothetical protein
LASLLFYNSSFCRYPSGGSSKPEMAEVRHTKVPLPPDVQQEAEKFLGSYPFVCHQLLPGNWIVSAK